ncbi:hypothetical protein EYE35_06935 [Cereibacter sphaeroides]|nr:hypothetical protein EYE35_06935 [Cereibacter sphaeroides]
MGVWRLIGRNGHQGKEAHRARCQDFRPALCISPSPAASARRFGPMAGRPRNSSRKAKKRPSRSSAQVQQGGMKRTREPSRSPASRGDLGLRLAAFKRHDAAAASWPPCAMCIPYPRTHLFPSGAGG